MDRRVLQCICSSYVKTEIPSFTKYLWGDEKTLVHGWHPLGSSIQVSASPFCTNQWRTVSHPRTSTGYQHEYILFCSFLSQGQKYKAKQKKKKKKKMEQRTAQNIQFKALCQESNRKFYTWAKGFLVSFKNLNRDNYLDVSWWIRSVYRTKACSGVLCTLRNNYFLSLFTFLRKQLTDRFKS